MPVKKGRLREDHETNITTNYSFLMHELDAQFLVCHMLENGVFDVDDKVDVDSQNSRSNRNNLFLTKLLHSGPGKAYNVFLQALKQNGYSHVFDVLKRNRGDGEDVQLNSTPPPETRKRKANRSREETTKKVQRVKCTPTSEIRNHLGRFDAICDQDHKSFIPTWSFRLEHLPEPIRYREVYEYIKCLAEQTVFVIGEKVSEKRPMTYWLSDEGGKHSEKQRGTGRLREVVKKFKTENSIDCPCRTCSSSSTPKKRWGAYIVTCPMHVIFNAEESKYATFQVGYDTDSTKCLKLYGNLVNHNDMSLNFSEVLCVSHEYKVCKKIEDICGRSDLAREELLAQQHHLEDGTKLAVLISHPHKQAKHVSIGQWVVGNDNLPHNSYRHAYKAAACPFSAGGPVLLLGDTMPCVTMHRRSVPDEGVNQSNGKTWSI